MPEGPEHTARGPFAYPRPDPAELLTSIGATMSVLHDLIDNLEKAVSYVRNGASVNMASIDSAVADLRQHADAQLADLGQTAVTDAKQLVGEAETAAAPVLHDAAQDAEQLAQTAVADVKTDVEAVAADVTAPASDPSVPAVDDSTPAPAAEATTPATDTAAPSA